MPYTQDDCSDLCWPDDFKLADHVECERRLSDMSNKYWDYCACFCHYDPNKPGFEKYTAGRYVKKT